MHSLYMPCQNPIISDIIYGSRRAYVLDHLPADGANSPEGQVAVEKAVHKRNKTDCIPEKSYFLLVV